MANTHATSHDPRIGAPAAVREAQTATGPQRGAPPADKAQLAVRCIHTMRTLAMDAVQQANSGHPGTPMAPVAFVLWDRHLLSVTGLTANPTIFDRAVTHSTAYDPAIRQKLTQGTSGQALFFELALEDLSRAADLFRPISAWSRLRRPS
jgi:Transketolase, thiamine diphosphate binding domain/Transaldolase/Fructose-6-phosphate aldolase